MSDIKIWMARRKLKLNEGKAEIIIVRGSLRNDLRADFGMLHFENTQLVPCECAKNLGVVLDSTLSFKPHIDSVVKICNFHIHNLYMIRNFRNRGNLLSLVHSLIVSNIDYCNSLLVGLPKVTLKKVQSILNRAARLIYSLPPQVPTNPFLMKLHWFPVKAMVEFKICVITFRALKFNQTLYIRELLSLRPVEPVMSLWSSDDPYHLCEPKAVGESNFANRSFWWPDNWTSGNWTSDNWTSDNLTIGRLNQWATEPVDNCPTVRLNQWTTETVNNWTSENYYYYYY